MVGERQRSKGMRSEQARNIGFGNSFSYTTAPQPQHNQATRSAVLNQTLDQSHLLHHHQPQRLQEDLDQEPDPDPDPDPDPSPVPTTTNHSSTPPPPSLIVYKECLKNHAANLGGHVLDGCGEFIPGGDHGTPEAFKCGACDCHRNFHRKMTDGEPQPRPNFYYTYNPNRNSSTHLTQAPPNQQSFPTGPSMVMLGFGGNTGARTESSSEDLEGFPSSFRVEEAMAQPSSSFSKKRFRTKFTQEQKEMMQEFADKLGWKIQKTDDQQLHHFCAQVGIKRQVFKVWMHNNKQAMKKNNSVD